MLFDPISCTRNICGLWHVLDRGVEYQSPNFWCLGRLPVSGHWIPYLRRKLSSDGNLITGQRFTIQIVVCVVKFTDVHHKYCIQPESPSPCGLLLCGCSQRKIIDRDKAINTLTACNRRKRSSLILFVSHQVQLLSIFVVSVSVSFCPARTRREETFMRQSGPLFCLRRGHKAPDLDGGIETRHSVLLNGEG